MKWNEWLSLILIALGFFFNLIFGFISLVSNLLNILEKFGYEIKKKDEDKPKRRKQKQ